MLIVLLRKNGRGFEIDIIGRVELNFAVPVNFKVLSHRASVIIVKNSYFKNFVL